MIMLASLVLILQAHPLLNTWFPQPTGENGLEDYVRAADELARPSFVRLDSDLSQITSKIGFPQTKVSFAFGKHGALLKPDNNITTAAPDPEAFLDLCEEERNACASAMDLIRTGNQKPLRTVSALFDNEDLFFDLTPFLQTLGNVALRTTYSEVGVGRRTSGIQSLTDILILSDRLTRTSLMGRRASGEIIDKSCSLCATLLSAMSLRDCETLDGTLQKTFGGRSAVEDQLDYERRLALQRIPIEVSRFANLPPQTGTPPKPIPGEISDTELELGIKKLDQSGRDDLVSRATSLSKTALDAFMDRFSKPENTWLDPLPTNELFQSVEFAKGSDLATQLAFKTTPRRLRAVTSSLMKDRERLRLLDIHARIRAFQWRHFRLPKALTEISPNLARDPINGQEFRYKVLSMDQYDLYSLGAAQTGEIRLVEPASSGLGKTPQQPPI